MRMTPALLASLGRAHIPLQIRPACASSTRLARLGCGTVRKAGFAGCKGMLLAALIAAILLYNWHHSDIRLHQAPGRMTNG